jgi:uncharacterized membrane protein YbhN (UPF0104 family)
MFGMGEKAKHAGQSEATDYAVDTHPRARRRLETLLPYSFSIFVLCGFAIYLYLNAARFRQLLEVSLAEVLSLCGLVLVAIFLKGVINHVFYRRLGTAVGLGEGIGLAIVNTMSNQLPFAGGLVAKALYLKKRHQLAYTRYASATVALYVCFVSSNGLLGIAGLAYQRLAGNPVPLLLVLGFSAMTTTILSFRIPVNLNLLPDRWEQPVTKLMDGWQLLKENRRLAAEVVGLQTILTGVAAVRLWIAFRALSQDATLNQCILFSSASILTRLVSISPGGLGVREAIVASVASVLGFDLGVSAVAVGLERLVSLPINIGLGIVYSQILGKKLVDTQAEAETQ